MSNSVVSQNNIEVLHGGEGSNSIVSQTVVQVLMEVPIGLRFQCFDCTNLINDTDTVDYTGTGLKWAILDNQIAASVTAIAEQNNNLDIEYGIGFVETETAPGTYLVIIQDDSGRIGAYVMDVT